MREQHGRDESPFDVRPPDAVVFCESTEEVAAAVALADRYAVPVIRSASASLEGHLLAVQGGISIDVSRMNRVLQVNPEDLTVTIRAGRDARAAPQPRDPRHRPVLPIDPGANASLGGMAATRASGTNAVRYGTMRENVLGLTVVTASGEVIRTGTRARKQRRLRPDARLMVGSEGTLGVITEITLASPPHPRGDLGGRGGVRPHRIGGEHHHPDDPARPADRTLRAAST